MNQLGMVFPGQGSQFQGMLADIAEHYPQVGETFAEAAKVLGYDLWELVQNGPPEELDKTVRTQPAMLAADVAIWRILHDQHSIRPALLAGHSLGEYSALVCAEAISFQDAVRLVAARGEFMQEAAPVGTGALAAIIGLDDQAVREICDKALLKNEVLAPANYNSPGQVVIAGHVTAVERALVLARARGARLVKLLPVSVSAHCLLMKPAAEKLTAILDTMKISDPQIPVLNNADVSIYENAQQVHDGLIKQLYMPVRWVETIETFSQHQITRIIECGPGKTLTGLNKRINPHLDLYSTGNLAGLETVLGSDLIAQKAS